MLIKELAISLIVAVVLSNAMLFGQAGPTQPEQEDGWENLRHVTHSRTYTVMDRGGHCVLGEIAAVTDQSLTLKRWDGMTGKRPTYSTSVIPRPEVLRLTDGPDVAIGMVFSGRSSWADVRNLRGIRSDEAVLVQTKNGKQQEGKITQISDGELKFERGGKTNEIAKGDISKVYYIREKPIDAYTQYVAQEMGVVSIADPAAWPYLLRIPPKVDVLVYDSSMPEDDTPIGCKNAQ